MDTTLSISIGTVNAAACPWQWFREYILWLLKTSAFNIYGLTTGSFCNLLRMERIFRGKIMEINSWQRIEHVTGLFNQYENYVTSDRRIRIRDPCRTSGNA